VTNGQRGTRWGFGAFFEDESGDLAPPSVLSRLTGLSVRTDEQVASLVADANTACRTLGNGTRDRSEFGLNFFHQSSVLGDATLDVSASLSRVRSDYASPLCIFRVGEFANGDILFFGTLTGEPKSTVVDMEVKLQKVFPTGWGFIVPRLTLSGEYAHHDAFSESETLAPAGTGVSNPNTNSPLLAEPTGTALFYQKRDTTLVVAEFGATIAWPFSQPRGDGVFWLDGSFVQSLVAPDRTVTARFVGDGRAAPSFFSFQGNPTDHNYFRVGLGIDFRTRNGITASVSASTILDHDFESNSAIGAALTWQF
jgi:autotransporter-like protein